MKLTETYRQCSRDTRGQYFTTKHALLMVVIKMSLLKAEDPHITQPHYLQGVQFH